jgi:hypothetical protein
MLGFVLLCIMCIYVLFFDLYLMVDVWYGVKVSSLIFADDTEWLFWNGVLAIIVLLIGCTSRKRQEGDVMQTEEYNNMDQILAQIAAVLQSLLFCGLFGYVRDLLD